MTIKELKNNKTYSEHHTSTMRGYVSRKTEGRIEPYKGRFGEGYKLLTPRFDTTTYCYVTYFVKEA